MTHDFIAALMLVPAALLIFVLMGSRVWLAYSNRAAGPRLRRMIALEPDEERYSRDGLRSAIFFSVISIVLLVTLVVNNIGRPDGPFALLFGAGGLASAMAWVAAMQLMTIPRQPPDRGAD